MARAFWLVLVLVIAVIAFATTQQRHRGERLPVAFAHADHSGENCIGCHHDFADHSGNGLCIDCHKRDAKLDTVIEAQFHDFCRGCHVERRHDGEDAGPVRACFACHHVEHRP